jgi:hypothetical protein
MLGKLKLLFLVLAISLFVFSQKKKDTLKTNVRQIQCDLKIIKKKVDSIKLSKKITLLKIKDTIK